MSGRHDWCKHYCGMHGHDKCNAGVTYDRFRVDGKLVFDELPCLNRLPEKCDQASYRTSDEIAAEKQAMDLRFSQIVLARATIVQKIGEYKRGKSQGTSGVIDCPVCNAKDSLRFSRAAYNGHIHAACKTEGCVRWME